MQVRRTFLKAVAGLSAASIFGPVFAQALPKPFVIYDDELKNGWQDWSWAKVVLSAPAGGAKPIKVQGDAWSAVSLHHDAFSTEGFSKLTFNINGGMVGEQDLTVKVMVDGKPVDSTYNIKPKAKTWALVEVALKDINGANKTIDGICIQAKGEAYTAYYITRIQLE